MTGIQLVSIIVPSASDMTANLHPSQDNSAKPADDLGGTGPRSSPTLKEPLENIYLLSGIPRSIPRVDLYGRKPVGDLPHARGYRNGFLGEANDALNTNICLFSVPILIYEAAKVIRKPTLG